MTEASPVPRKFTVAELAGFNGQSGAPAYVAYKGKVYDVSGLIPLTLLVE